MDNGKKAIGPNCVHDNTPSSKTFRINIYLHLIFSKSTITIHKGVLLTGPATTTRMTLKQEWGIFSLPGAALAIHIFVEGRRKN
jgi:hypothetical protein